MEKGSQEYKYSITYLISFLFSLFEYTETAARVTLEQVITEALSKSGADRSAVCAVCLGVSGVNHPTDRERILIWLRFGFWKPFGTFFCQNNCPFGCICIAFIPTQSLLRF